MPTLLQNLRLALRQLRKAPGFTVTAVLTLAVGIGATTAIFTLVYDVMLRPLPYKDAGQLVMVEERVAEFRDIYPTLPVNANHFDFWQKNSRSLAAIAVMHEESLPLGAGGHPFQVQVVNATPGIFSVLQSSPQLGRGFSEAEGQPGHERVVVLMHGLWRDQFQSDPQILGKTVTLNGFAYTVVGVMAESFHLPELSAIGGDVGRSHPVAAIVPLAFNAGQLAERMGDFNYFGLARLQAGVSAAQANAEIDGLQRTISAGLSAEEKGTLSAVVTPFQQALVGTNRTPFLILLAAVGGLLVVGCVNITNLLLARATGRRQQTAIATALGARRGEILQMAMLETLLLAAAGGALGILLAALLVPAMQSYLPPALNFRGALHLDWAGAGCAVLLSVAAALAAGAVPAWISSRTQPGEVLHSESRLASESRGSKRVRRILVGVEVAVSVALVLMTGLLVTSLVRLMHTERGFTADRVMTAEIDLPGKTYSSTKVNADLYQAALARVSALPGVESAGVVSKMPLGGDRWLDAIRVPGDARSAMQLPSQHFRWISPGYFETIHLPLVAGRLLSAEDAGKSYAVISELTAQTMWPGKDAVGREFQRGGVDDEPPFTVIGVVGNARTLSLAKADPMMVYMPYWYRADRTGSLLVRTKQDPGAMADEIRRAVWSVDPTVSVPEVRTLGGVIADSVASRRFEMDLLLLFAVSALLLAGLGIYGVVTYSVVQREREIGLRLALGAQKANIYRLVLRDGVVPVLLGVVGGIAIAFGFARVVGSLLFEVSPYNPAVVGATIVVLISVGTVACLIPARRAASVDPMQALRAE